MKLLLLTKKFPWPLKDGEVIAIHNNIAGFAKLGHQVTVVAINTLKHFTSPQRMPDTVFQQARYISVTVDTNVKVASAVANLFTSKPYHVARFESDAYTQVLTNVLQETEFDLIQCEGLYFGPYLDVIRKYSKAPVVMRAHNVESEIWERVADETANPLKKHYLRMQVKRLQQYERAQLNRYNAIATITARDAERLKQMGATVPMFVHPSGIDLERYTLNGGEPAKPQVVGFIGSLDWLPNLEGVRWFLKEVWPRVLQQEPHAIFNIAGRNMPASIENLQQRGVEVAGEVPDALAFMQQQQVLVVPLFSGSGMRIKIVEAMALGKCVLSTSIGAEGIAITDGDNLLLANDAESFAVQLIELMRQPETVARVGSQARASIEREYDNRALSEKLLAFYQKQFNL